MRLFFFFFNDTATTEIYTLSLHDALPICGTCHDAPVNRPPTAAPGGPYGAPEGTVISFDGSGSTDLDGDALTYAWDFGDGTTATGVKPSHTYADNGSYTLTLTRTHAQGAARPPAP